MKTKYVLIAGILFALIISCENRTSRDSTAPSIKTEDLLNKGNEIAQKTFQSLSSELQKSMKEGGLGYAIKYCNLNAIPITEKLSKEHNALIKRTSLRYRNPNNAPNDEEKEILLTYQNELEHNENLKSIIIKKEETAMFYSPIIVQEMCLKCHGPKKSIPSYDTILSMYPNDMAFNYKSGDLRGMWSIALLPTQTQ